MRFLLKVVMDVEAANRLAKAGKLATTIQSILADLKPEAAYFTPIDGQRAAYLIFEMEDASQMPAVATPWFLALNANVEIHPVRSQGIWSRRVLPWRRQPINSVERGIAISA